MLFDSFLTQLAARGVQVLVISGNHDSAERIAFASRLVSACGVHLSPVYDGTVEPVTLTDADGAVDFFLLPFLKPAHVRRFYPDAGIETYTDALRTAIAHMPVDPGRRSVLVAHQFVTGAQRSESEEISVGGLDNVDASVFEPFDYVALGHLHGPQSVGRETVRYCGTPLKYSFSEKDQVKSVTIVDLGKKGEAGIDTIPLHPAHDLREIRGSYDELTLRAHREPAGREDYIRAVLTDEDDVPNAKERLQSLYPNLMLLDYDNTRTRTASVADAAEEIERKSASELFEELYEKQNGRPMSEEQRVFCAALFEKIEEEAR